MKNWQKYQIDVGKLFQKLGCTAEIEAKVEGVRSTHEIDVWVKFDHFGLEHKWVVECKYWEKPITKEKVLALNSLVQDVGADRGILVAESGFQPGAWRAAKSTNIELTTLEELQDITRNDFLKISLESLESKIDVISNEMTTQLYSERKIGPSKTSFYPNPNYDVDICSKASIILSNLKFSIEYIRDMGEYHIIRNDKHGNYIEFFDTLEEYLQEANLIVSKMKEIWKNQKDKSENN